MTDFLPVLLVDGYKTGHIVQYPTDVTHVWSNWTPRTTRLHGQNSVVHFGLQYFCREYLQHRFRYFFGRPLREVVAGYRALISAYLGVENPKTDHIEALWRLGYLPIRIYSIPEGFSTNLNVPSMVITNTLPEFFWLPNYFETMLSMTLWKPSTSATRAQRYRRIGMKWARRSGETDFGFIDWQFHDFSMRGMSGLEDSMLSGMGHLTSFSGTDSIPAILAADRYYNAGLNCGGSVPATEHSVMCAGGQDGEFETFRHLIEDVYPTGIVSIVSDTWDLWKVLTDYIPRLKDSILNRRGKIVIRPDSGDPVKIILGDRDRIDSSDIRPKDYGVIRLLAKALGADANRKGLPLIRNAGAIYGDSINEERAEAILKGLVEDVKVSPCNMVFGVGSYTYEFVTRDTFGFAMKATAVRRNGEVVDIFKDPVTDDGGKRSHKGIPAVYRTKISTEDNPEYFVKQGARPEDLDNCAFETVFLDGELKFRNDFATIRKRVRAWERDYDENADNG